MTFDRFLQEAALLEGLAWRKFAHYLTREKGHWGLAGEVKGLVRLERRNVMSDPLPSGMDLVL